VQAILEEEPFPVPVKPDTSSVTITSYHAHDITLEAFSDKPSLLVLSEIYYPPGWKAYVDGKETKIYKTNYVLRSVVVPAGKHAVEFKYYSATYALGLTVSSVGWAITLVLVLMGVIPQLWRRRDSLIPMKKKNVEPHTSSGSS
jgi:hypothetical protein